MSFPYASDLAFSGDQSIMGKRMYCELEKNIQPAWQAHPCKRPRVFTPGSAISAITHEDDSSATVSPPIGFEEAPESPRFDPAFRYSVDSNAVFQENVLARTFEPCSERSSPARKLRTDEDIQADIGNSFAAGLRGTAGWSNELLVQVLANEIEDLIYSNDERNETVDAGEFQTFYSSYKQPFELDFYMRRLVQYVNCSPSVFVSMFVYLDRVQERCKALQATDMNCHRLVFTCLVLAVKNLEDEVHSNAYYARVGGLTVEEMNNLEVKLLKVLDWNLSVSPETFVVYEEGMVQTAGLLMGGNDGTYSGVSEV